jgi:hypothetical protein
MKRYLFNVEMSYAVIADSLEQARELLDDDKADLRDRNVLLVDEEGVK